VSLVRDFILRYSLSRHQQRFTRIVAWISTLGMALGVASLITVMSIMNGFSAELHQRILSLVAHARIEAIASRTGRRWRQTSARCPGFAVWRR